MEYVEPSSPAKRAWGEEGYLADKGLIPLPAEERKTIHNAAMSSSGLDDVGTAAVPANTSGSGSEPAGGRREPGTHLSPAFRR